MIRRVSLASTAGAGPDDVVALSERDVVDEVDLDAPSPSEQAPTTSTATHMSAPRRDHRDVTT